MAVLAGSNLGYSTFRNFVPFIVRLFVDRSPAGSLSEHSNLSLQSKSKAVPLHAMEAHGGGGGIAPTHS
jgi:hypothetical protein